jgi:hypothetical protein
MLPCLASAHAPGNMALGEVDAILKFCARTDSRFEKSVQELETALTSKASQGARGSAEYKQGYDLVSDALAKINTAQALATCTQDLKEPKHRDDTHGHHR